MNRKVIFLLLSGLLLSSCSSAYQPFAGVSRGKNNSYYASVEALNYNYEGVLSGNVNGGCIPNTSAIAAEDVGKKRFGGGSTCGGFSLPAKWKSGMTVRVSWEISPHPNWYSSLLPGGGFSKDPVEDRIVTSYNERYSVDVPLPPPPPHAGDDFGKVSNVTVHFLACNQLYIDYGTNEEDKSVKRDFALFKESQKLCKPRAVVKSMADYRKNKTRMDASREERKHIPQVILPAFIDRLAAEGKLPVSSN